MQDFQQSQTYTTYETQRAQRFASAFHHPSPRVPPVYQNQNHDHPQRDVLIFPDSNDPSAANHIYDHSLSRRVVEREPQSNQPQDGPQTGRDDRRNIQPEAFTDSRVYITQADGAEPCSLTHRPHYCLTTRCVTADRALSHVCHMERHLLETLAQLRYDGLYRVQVGFNELMLEKGLRIEEIYLSLDADLETLSDSVVCPAFEEVFAPFPGMVWTPGKVYQVLADDLMQALSKDSEYASLSRTNNQGSAKGNTPRTSLGGGNGHDGGQGGSRSYQGSKRGEEKNNDSHSGDGDGGGQGGGDDDGGGGGGGGGGNGDAKKSNPRVLDIRGFGSTLTINNSHQVNAIGNFNIIVSVGMV